MTLSLNDLPFDAEGAIAGLWRVQLTHPSNEDVAGARFLNGVAHVSGHQLARMCAVMPVCGLSPADDAAREHLLQCAAAPSFPPAGPHPDPIITSATSILMIDLIPEPLASRLRAFVDESLDDGSRQLAPLFEALDPKSPDYSRDAGYLPTQRDLDALETLLEQLIAERALAIDDPASFVHVSPALADEPELSAAHADEDNDASNDAAEPKPKKAKARK